MRDKLNQLLSEHRPGMLYFSSWLAKHGYSYQLQKKYRESSWLESISKGVMFRSGDTLLDIPAVATYNQQLDKHFHIAAHSALEYLGFNHYVPMGRSDLVLSHPKEEVVPEWMTMNVFERDFFLFSTDTFFKNKLENIKIDKYYIVVSSAEQAFLECLLLSPSKYYLMDLYYIMEQLTTLRADVLQVLLENTKNLRVKRLFLYMAEKAAHEWYNQIVFDNIDLGRGKQKLVFSGEGVYIPKYKITLPRELSEYE